jgi:phage terminase large subunit-like protein
VDIDGRLYVAGSWGDRMTPVAWLTWAVRKAAQEGATIVVEKNHGAAYLVGLLERVMRDLGIRAPVKTIHASQGKRARAEPVAGLYEQGKVHHLGVFEGLEGELTGWDGNGQSPNLLDACVYALTDLMGYGRTRTGTGPLVHRYTDEPVPGVVRWSDADT